MSFIKNNNMLTSQEKKETPFVTLGRIRGSIKLGNEKRALELLNKLAKDLSELDLKTFKLKTI